MNVRVFGRSCCQISDLGHLKEMAAAESPGCLARRNINIRSRVESLDSRDQGTG